MTKLFFAAALLSATVAHAESSLKCPAGSTKLVECTLPSSKAVAFCGVQIDGNGLFVTDNSTAPVPAQAGGTVDNIVLANGTRAAAKLAIKRSPSAGLALYHPLKNGAGRIYFGAQQPLDASCQVRQ